MLVWWELSTPIENFFLLHLLEDFTVLVLWALCSEAWNWTAPILSMAAAKLLGVPRSEQCRHAWGQRRHRRCHRFRRCPPASIYRPRPNDGKICEAIEVNHLYDLKGFLMLWTARPLRRTHLKKPQDWSQKCFPLHQKTMKLVERRRI